MATKETPIEEVKTSKIVEIIKESSWEHKPSGKTIYYTEVKMENDEKITLGKQQKDAYKVGDTIKYQKMEKDANWKKSNYWKEITEKQQFFSSNKKPTSMYSNKQFALQSSINYYNLRKDVVIDKNILETANMFLKWLEEE